MQKTKRFTSEGAERWLEQEIKCLDHGFIRLVDYMGGDDSIVQAARVSYGKGTKKTSEDAALIRYLLRHIHTTPFEMVEFKFHCKLPIFVARQWIRHRTANVNEYSGRYSQMPNEFYLPERKQLCAQSTSNNQGRAEELPQETQEFILEKLRKLYRDQTGAYNEFLEKNFAKELARIGLSVANYTEWYWKIDLHNLLHFLRLRLDAHAQWEIRVYAEAMAKVIKDAVPVAWKAFEEYRLNSLALHEMEIRFIKRHSAQFPISEPSVWELLQQDQFIESKREIGEFIQKLKRLNLLII